MKSSLKPVPQLFAQTSAPARSRRFASMMYEGVLLFAVVFLADYLFDTLTQSKHGLMLRSARQAAVFCAIGVYFLVCWVRSGQTLPMKAWHIRLVGLDGTPARLPRLLLRFVLMWVLPTLMLIVAAPFTVLLPTWFTPQQQFLHDLLAGTRLISVEISKNP